MIRVTVDRVTSSLEESGVLVWHNIHAGVEMPPQTQAFVISGVDDATGEGLDAVVSVTGRVELWAEGRATYGGKLLARVIKRLRRVLAQMRKDMESAHEEL